MTNVEMLIGKALSSDHKGFFKKAIVIADNLFKKGRMKEKEVFLQWNLKYGALLL